MGEPMVVRVQIEGQLAWRAFRDPVTATWVGVCDHLKLTARGESWHDLEEDIHDLVQTIFADLLSDGPGAFETFLQLHGWRPIGALPQAGVGEMQFDLPTPIEHVAHA